MDQDTRIFWDEEREVWVAYCDWHGMEITSMIDRDQVIFSAGFHVGHSH